MIVRPETVIAWRRQRFRNYWRKLSRAGKPGRPAVAREIRGIIRRMSLANPLWGAPHIVGELKKTGIELAPLDRRRLHEPKPEAALPDYALGQFIRPSASSLPCRELGIDRVNREVSRLPSVRSHRDPGG